MGIDPERLWFEFCRHGIQYYAAGRWSELMGLLPVYGNQHHHAVEMFLKAALTRERVSLGDLKDMGHDLNRLWAEFKRRFAGDTSLAEYDTLIVELDKFENIRYPDAILRTGITGGTSIVPGDRAEMWSDQPLPPHYEVNLGEIDGLVAKIVAVIGVNRRVLINKLPMKEAKDTLLERNPHAAFWQIADD
jgi:hypothetical protein